MSAAAKYPRAVDLGVVQAEIDPRLLVLQQVLWASAFDQVGDVCPTDPAARMNFFQGLANIVEDVRDILEQSQGKVCDDDEDAQRTRAKRRT